MSVTFALVDIRNKIYFEASLYLDIAVHDA
jgi:hypothetical protein